MSLYALLSLPVTLQELEDSASLLIADPWQGNFTKTLFKAFDGKSWSEIQEKDVWPITILADMPFQFHGFFNELDEDVIEAYLIDMASGRTPIIVEIKPIDIRVSIAE